MRGLRDWWRGVARRRTPRAMRHMAELHAAFAIDVIEATGMGDTDESVRRVCWRGRPVCDLVPLSRFGGTYGGRPLFVLGSGPSLTGLDPACLADKVVIAVNGSIAALRPLAERGAVSGWYLVTDPDFVEHRFELLKLGLRSGAHCLFSAAVLSAICAREPAALFCARVSLVETHFCRYGQARLRPAEVIALARAHPRRVWTRDGRVGFSADPALGLFPAHTVVFYALQLACFFGAGKVFMLGVDLLPDGDRVRFYERVASARPSGLERDYRKYILPAFEALRAFCADRPGFVVFNLSPRSRLPADVVPRLTLEQALRADERWVNGRWMDGHARSAPEREMLGAAEGGVGGTESDVRAAHGGLRSADGSSPVAEVVPVSSLPERGAAVHSRRMSDLRERHEPSGEARAGSVVPEALGAFRQQENRQIWAAPDASIPAAVVDPSQVWQPPGESAGEQPNGWVVSRA